MEQRKKKIVYVDMDGVLVDFASGLERVAAETRDKYAEQRRRDPRHLRADGPDAGRCRRLR